MHHASADVSRLDRLAEIADELGNAVAAADARALRERVSEGRFFVACLGQFKRGKSTLLNVLLGESILPVGVAPVTAVVTAIRWGETLRARVRVEDQDWREIDARQLEDYVAEAKNPENAMKVRAVEVFVPSPLLRSGMCLVDTPGVGSVFTHNTEATRELVPHIDAALVVIGADPPLAKSELDLVAEIAGDVERILFVMAKADRLSPADLQEGKAFATEVLTRQFGGKPPETILEVSAHERRGTVVAGEAIAGRMTRDWAKLEAMLVALGDEGRIALVRASARRGIARLERLLTREIEQQKDALVRPRDESEKRIALLRQAVAQAEQLLFDMRYLFAAVQDQLSAAFEKDRLAFMEREEPIALHELGTRIRADEANGGVDVASRAMDHARDIGRSTIEKWRAESGPTRERQFEDAGKRFVDLANDFLQRVASSNTTASGDDALSSLPDTFDAETHFRTKPRFFFLEHMKHGTPSIVRRAVGVVQTRVARTRSIVDEAAGYLLRLFETNSERSSNDVIEQVRLSRVQLHKELSLHLQGVVDAAERSLARASKTIDEGAEAVARNVARLDALRSEVEPRS